MTAIARKFRDSFHTADGSVRDTFRLPLDVLASTHGIDGLPPLRGLRWRPAAMLGAQQQRQRRRRSRDDAAALRLELQLLQLLQQPVPELVGNLRPHWLRRDVPPRTEAPAALQRVRKCVRLSRADNYARLFYVGRSFNGLLPVRVYFVHVHRSGAGQQLLVRMLVARNEGLKRRLVETMTTGEGADDAEAAARLEAIAGWRPAAAFYCWDCEEMFGGAQALRRHMWRMVGACGVVQRRWRRVE